jgi:hypothetical protein
MDLLKKNGNWLGKNGADTIEKYGYPGATDYALRQSKPCMLHTLAIMVMLKNGWLIIPT